jgi:hypothetical protein
LKRKSAYSRLQKLLACYNRLGSSRGEYCSPHNSSLSYLDAEICSVSPDPAVLISALSSVYILVFHGFQRKKFPRREKNVSGI